MIAGRRKDAPAGACLGVTERATDLVEETRQTVAVAMGAVPAGFSGLRKLALNRRSAYDRPADRQASSYGFWTRRWG